MDQNLTFNAIVLKKSYDVEGKSFRQSTARGANTPDRLTVQHQEYVDSKTKVPGWRYTFRFDRVSVDANLQEIVSSAYWVVAVPKTELAASVTSMLTTFREMVSTAGVMEAVINKEL